MKAAFPDFPERSITPVPGRRVYLLALGAGVGVANVYYIQPSLHLVQVAFGADAYAVGWVPTLTQIGYALGMLLLAPLGDLMDRKRLILCKAGLLTLALTIGDDVHRFSASKYELIDFIASKLPLWRDDPDRPKAISETNLTSQLCAYLNSASRFSEGWDSLQFKVEESDEHQKGRKIDLVVSPRGSIVWAQGRKYTQYDTLLPIECKRLPTPKGKKRDDREYVINQKATTGGIQRFKAGDHSAAHSLAAMIAYVQAESSETWYDRLNVWIKELDDPTHTGWSTKDLMHIDSSDTQLGLTVLRSLHSREKGLSEIEIRHLWIEMECYLGA